MISGSGLLNVVVQLIVFGLIAYVIWWAIGFIGLPEPFNKIVTVLLVLFCAVFLINLLLGLTGHAFIRY